MSQLWEDGNGKVVQIVTPDKSTIQNVAVGGTSTPTSAAVPNSCGLVILISTTDCWFNWGTSPIAAKDNTSVFLPAKSYFYLPVAGGVDKVAFIQDSASGTAQVIPAK